MAPYVRTVKTASGATAVQVVWSKRSGRLDLEHVGSAHDDVELAALRRAAWERITAGQEALDLGLDGALPRGRAAFRIVSSRSGRLLDALAAAIAALGFAESIADEAFWSMVIARIVAPGSKRDAGRVLGRLGADWVPAYRTIENALDRCVQRDYRGTLESACATWVNVTSVRFCLYDVTTLYWETDRADDFKIPGFSKERRLEPQITLGLLTDTTGFPLMVRAFEGNKAETTTIVPVLNEFRQANPEVQITVVADAGMMSEANLKALEDAGYRFIVGGRIPVEPGAVRLWRIEHPDAELADQQTFSTTWNGTKKAPRTWHVYYQYRTERAKRNKHGIDASVAKATKIIDGKATAKKNRFLMDTGGTLGLDEELIASAKARAGIRSYMTNLPDTTPQFVIDTYHQLYHVEQSFRISKHDLRARPAYHFKRDRIEAHLTVVFAALAISKWIESVTTMSIRAFLHTVEPIRQVVLDINGIPTLGEDEITDTARTALHAIDHATTSTHGH